MERACGDSAGRAVVVDAHRQADQCRISHRSLDAARQHHDAGAGDRDRGARARGGPGSGRATAASASDSGARAGLRQKAAGAEAPARDTAGPDRASGTSSRGGANSRGVERLMLSKAGVDR